MAGAKTKLLHRLHRVREFFRTKPSRFLFVAPFLGAVWFITVYAQHMLLAQATLYPVSDRYYANVPTASAVRIAVPGFVWPFLPVSHMVESAQGIPITVHQDDNLFTVVPKDGAWQKSSPVTLYINRPPGVAEFIASFLSPRGFGPLKKRITSISFVTAGPFGVLESRTADAFDPQGGFTLRFNEPLMDPGTLNQYLEIPGLATPSAAIFTGGPVEEQTLTYAVTSPELHFNTSYTLVIKRGLMAATGEELKEDIVLQFKTIPNPNAPQVSFGEERVSQRLIVYPDIGAPRPLKARFKNVPEVTLTLYRANAADALRYLIYTRNEDSYWSSESEYRVDTGNMEQLWQETVVGPKNGDLKLPDNLSAGMYVMEAEVPEGDAPVRAYVFLNVTRLGAVAKAGTSTLAVWSSDVNTGEPVSGATVRMYRLEDGAVIQSEGTTDSEGLAALSNPGASDLAVVFAGRDVTFIPLNVPGGHTGTAGGDPDYNGFWRSYPDPARAITTKAYIVTDRPIYKPGDTVHYKSIVRTDKDASYAVPAGTTYTVALRKDYWNPQSRPVTEQSVTAGTFGTVWGTMKLSEEIKPGEYYLMLGKGEESFVSQGILVSQYRKPLYHLETSAVIIGDKQTTLKADINGTFSFGMPAKDKIVTWRLYSDPVWLQYDNNDAEDPYAPRSSWYGDSAWWYDYSDYHDKQLTAGTVTLNANGEAVIAVDLSKTQLLLARSHVLTFTAEIMDEGITPETEKASVRYDPSGYSLAVVSTDYEKESAALVTELTDNLGRPVTDSEVKLTGKDLKAGESGRTDKDGRITWDMRGKFGQSNGSSDMVFSWKDAQGRTEERQASFWYYSSYYGDSVETQNGFIGQASVTFPDEVIYGSEPELTVSEGGAVHLVVIERGDIVDMKVVADGASTPIPITDAVMPNAYISTYSFWQGKFVKGYTDILVTDLPAYRAVVLTVATDKPEYAPGDTAHVTVETKDAQGNPLSAEVYLAVVDKALFELKKSATKPIHPEFYRRRSDTTVYGVNLSGIWEWGGGGGGGGGGGAEPRDRFADTAYVNPEIRTDENGRATITFELPDNLTTWVMDAHAVTTDTYVGDTTSEFRVQKSIFALPVYPEYVMYGDDAWFGAVVGNMTGGTQAVQASFAFDNRAPAEKPTQTLSLSGGSSALVQWRQTARTEGNAGSAALVVARQSGEVLDAVNSYIPVHSKDKMVSTRTSGIGAGSARAELIPGADVSASRAYLTLTSGILGYVSEVLSYQAGYPYGCVEQTMSRFYPSLLANAYLPYLTISDTGLTDRLPDMIEKGIARIARFQHDDGGWGLWEYDKSSVFNTSYVVSGLVLLRDRVPAGMLEQAEAYLVKESTGPVSVGERAAILGALTALDSNDADGVADMLPDPSSGSLDDFDVARAAVALAEINHEKKESYSTELIKRAKLSGDGMAYWGAGKNIALHPHANLTTAVAIQALLLADPDHDLVSKALNYLNSHRNTNMYGSTYANSQVVRAFVEYSRRFSGTSPSYTITVLQNGTEKLRAAVTRANQHIGPVVLDPDKPVEIRQEGEGTILWDIRTDNMLGVLAENRPVQEYSLNRRYVNVSRPGKDIRIGDIVEVHLTVENTGTRFLPNMAVEDPVPAGLEAVNTRLDNQRQAAGRTGAGHWYATEIHSDRVSLFPYDLAPGQSETVSYLARAFVPGTYMAKPSSAMLMYEPGIPALTKSERIHISP